MYDVLNNVENKHIKCLDKGFVKLLDCMPRFVADNSTADEAIAQMARVSYGDGTKKLSDDRTLIRYLLRNSHTSPIEAIEIKLHLKMPMFCARQWMRHRSASLCEISGRYSIIKDEFYIPDTANIKQQSVSNKQGGDLTVDKQIADGFISDLERYNNEGYWIYQKYLDANVSREQSRALLSANVYTEFFWKQDLHNLLHLLALRCDPHTQYETQQFANAILQLITPIAPFTIEAWNDYHPMRGAMKLTRLELDALKRYLRSRDKDDLEISCSNKREILEWKNKTELLGILK